MTQPTPIRHTEAQDELWREVGNLDEDAAFLVDLLEEHGLPEEDTTLILAKRVLDASSALFEYVKQAQGR